MGKGVTHMKVLSMFGLAVVALATAVVGAGQLGFLAGTPPAQLGVTDGRLQRPSLSPNSVSSQAALYAGHPQLAYANIEPLSFTGDGDAAMTRLAALLERTSGTLVVKRQPGYIYAQCTTPLLRFTDDVEFWLDGSARQIQVRSASRLGRKDFGANRARIEAIRARFQP